MAGLRGADDEGVLRAVGTGCPEIVVRPPLLGGGITAGRLGDMLWAFDPRLDELLGLAEPEEDRPDAF